MKNSGLSAYEVWLAQGHTGTAADYLASLVGPPGSAGPPGAQGVAGQGATDIGLIAASDWTPNTAGPWQTPFWHKRGEVITKVKRPARRLGVHQLLADLTKSGGSPSSSMTESTADPLLHDRNIRATVNSAAADMFLLMPTFAPTLDLTNKIIGFPIKIDDLSKVSNARLEVTSDNFVNMHVSPSADVKNGAYMTQGEWCYCTFHINDFVISTAGGGSAGANLAAIDRIRYRFSSSSGVYTADIQWVDIIDPATKAKCILWFDDAHLAHYQIAALKLGKFGFPGTLALNPKQVDWDATAMTLAQLRKLVDNQAWQVASHAWSNNDHNADVTGQALEEQLAKVRHWQTVHGFTGGDDMAYWGGAGVGFKHSVSTHRALARRLFRSGRLTFGGRAGGSIETLPVGDSLRSRAWLVTAGDTGAQMTAYIDRCIAAKGLAQFVWHNNLTGADAVAQDTLLAYLDANRATIDVVTAADAYEGR